MHIRTGLREKNGQKRDHSNRKNQGNLARQPPTWADGKCAGGHGVAAGFDVEPAPSGLCVIVTYSVLDHSLEELENLLIATEHRLGVSLLIKIRRAIAYYGEACLRSNLNVPSRDQHLRDIYSSAHNRSTSMQKAGKIYYQ